MANPYTTTELMNSIIRRGMLMKAPNALDTADYLAFADDEIRTSILPKITALDEEYKIADYDVAVSSSTAEYAIPPRAAGDALRQVLLKVGTDDFQPLSRVEPERRHYLSQSGSVEGYVFEDGKIILVPSLSASGTLRLKHARRANRLVQTSAVGEIQSINTGTKTVTFTAANPSTFSTSQTYDIIQGTPPFKTLAMDQTATAVTGSTVTFTNSLPTDLAVGDFVCLKEETPIPLIPLETHAYLAEKVAGKALHALGFPSWKDFLGPGGSCDQMWSETVKILSPRDRAGSRYVVNFHGPGWGGDTRGRWR